MTTTATESFWDKAPALIRATRSADFSQSVVEVSSPPSRITGGKVTNETSGIRLLIDHFAATYEPEKLPELRRWLSHYLGPCEDRPIGANSYAKSAEWAGLGYVAWTEGRKEAYVKIHGAGMNVIGMDLWEFIRGMRKIGVRPTRLDLTLDDFSKSLLQLRRIKSAVKKEQWAGPRNYKFFEQGKRGNPAPTGEGIYFGERGNLGSGAYLRFYDKEKESKGEIHAIRMELELCDEKAKKAWQLIRSCNSIESVLELVGKILIGCIDFVERKNSHNHKDRMKRLGWWQNVVDQVEGTLPLRIQRLKTPFQKSIGYHDFAWERSLGRLQLTLEKQGADAEMMILFKLKKAKERAIAEGLEPDEHFDIPRWLGLDGDAGKGPSMKEDFAAYMPDDVKKFREEANQRILQNSSDFLKDLFGDEAAKKIWVRGFAVPTAD